MQIYLVGGAVRDKLLNRPVTERDWVVVGATVEEMLAQHFKPVGKDFPVFLHPETHEEYALARTERKVSKGYTGFTFYASPEVTLEQDLQRRDLTINAMAQTVDGKIIDPFNGQQDLQDRLLRHVSPAFVEDPVRILRIARFAARFGEFRIAPETMQLMKEMVQNGEVDALVAERIWQELQRALSEPQSRRFFIVLQECGALRVIFPEIDALFGVPNPAEHHPEVDSGIHTMLALQAAARLTPDAKVRFAVLLHDIGKIKTPVGLLPKHYGHGEVGVPIVKHLCKRLNAPNEYRDLAVLVCRYHAICHRALELRADTILGLLKTLDPFRRPQRFEEFLLACQADALSRGKCNQTNYPPAAFLKKIYQCCAGIKLTDAEKKCVGADIAEILYKKRLAAVKRIMNYKL